MDKNDYEFLLLGAQPKYTVSVSSDGDDDENSSFASFAYALQSSYKSTNSLP